MPPNWYPNDEELDRLKRERRAILWGTRNGLIFMVGLSAFCYLGWRAWVLFASSF